MTRARSALLGIRVWLREGSTTPLRAFVGQTADVGDGFEHAVTLTESRDLLPNS